MYRTDGDVRQVIALVTNPIVSGTWDVHPYGGEDATDKDIEIAQFVKFALFEAMEPNFIGHLAEMLPVLTRSGFVPFEQVWKRVNWNGKERLVLHNLQLRLPRTIQRWNTDKKGDLVSLEQYLPNPLNGQTAVTMPMDNLVYYRIGAEGDNWEGISMLRPAYKHWKLKDAIERIDAIAQEREGMGIPVVYPPMGATPEQLGAMEEILANMRANEQGYIIMPGPHSGDADGGQGWRIDLLGFDRNGSGRDPMPSLRYHTDKIMAAFVSEFMRLGHGDTGARATAQVQANPFMDSVEALSSVIERTGNSTLVAKLVALNYGDVEHLPELRMSLVDSTSLTQLSDFVSKLVMVGAMLPDQILENYLRDRADLPPPDPKAVQARLEGKADFDARREVIIGPDPVETAKEMKKAGLAPQPSAGGGTRGSGGKPGVGGGRQTPGGFGAKAAPGLPHGNKPVPAKSQSTTSLDTDPEPVTLARREPDQYESHVDLDGIEMRLDAAPDAMESALRDEVYRIRNVLGGAKRDHKAATTSLQARIRDHLQSFYDYGQQTAQDEIDRQTGNKPGLHHLSNAGVVKELDNRAAFEAKRIHHDMQSMYEHHGMQGSPDHVTLSAAEKAGRAASRRAGFAQTMPAFNLGRESVILDNASGPVVGVRYTAILDKNTCGPCEEADDGQVRSLDDPVRIDRRPPNRHCMSNLSGHNMCRCFEVPVVSPTSDTTSLDATLVPDKPGKNNWIDKTGTGDLPKKIADMAGDLITERGFDVGHAIATAVNNARKLAPTHPEWAAALAEWEAKKAEK